MDATICVFCLLCVCVCMCVCNNKPDEINQRISGIIASFLEVFVKHTKIMDPNLRCAPVFVHYFRMSDANLQKFSYYSLLIFVTKSMKWDICKCYVMSVGCHDFYIFKKAAWKSIADNIISVHRNIVYFLFIQISQLNHCWLVGLMSAGGR